MEKLEDHLPKADKIKTETEHKSFMNKVEAHGKIPVKKVVDGKIITVLYDREKNEYSDDIVFNSVEMRTKEIETIKVQGQADEETKKLLAKMSEELEKQKEQAKLQAEEIERLKSEAQAKPNEENTNEQAPKNGDKDGK